MTTTEIPGGSRALASQRTVDVQIADAGSGELPIPSLAGALVRDAADLVRLLVLVEDVDVIRTELKPSERRALRRVTPLGDETNAVWRTVPEADDAIAAFARISG